MEIVDIDIVNIFDEQINNESIYDWNINLGISKTDEC